MRPAPPAIHVPVAATALVAGLAVTAGPLPPPPLDAAGIVEWTARLGPAASALALVRVVLLVVTVRLAVATLLALAAAAAPGCRWGPRLGRLAHVVGGAAGRGWIRSLLGAGLASAVLVPLPVGALADPTTSTIEPPRLERVDGPHAAPGTRPPPGDQPHATPGSGAGPHGGSRPDGGSGGVSSGGRGPEASGGGEVPLLILVDPPPGGDGPTREDPEGVGAADPSTRTGGPAARRGVGGPGAGTSTAPPLDEEQHPDQEPSRPTGPVPHAGHGTGRSPRPPTPSGAADATTTDPHRGAPHRHTPGPGTDGTEPSGSRPHDAGPVDPIDPAGRPTPPVAASTAALPAWTIRPGEHLWHVAEATAAVVAPGAGVEEVATYHRRLVEANRSRLPVPDNADLVFPGNVVIRPAWAP